MSNRTNVTGQVDEAGTPTIDRAAGHEPEQRPRIKKDHRSTVTRIEVSWFHAGGCTEHQRALFQQLALAEAVHVRAKGFDPVRYGSRQTWLLTTTNTRKTAALAAVTEIINMEGTK